MTEEQIKGNKLIVVFRGMEVIDEYTFNDNGFRIDRGLLNYHCSWDMLMPVVEKIEKLGYISTIEKINSKFKEHRVWFNEVGTLKEIAHGARHENKLTAVYEGIVDFIEWYNIKLSNK